jgi:two-component system LytT family sensor kinase
MHGNRLSMKQLLRLSAIVFGLWTLLGLCAGTLDSLQLYSIGRHPDYWTFREPLIVQWIWAAFTPLVFVTAQRFPLRRPALLLALSMHTGCFLSLSMLHSVITASIGTPLGGVPPEYHGSLLKLRFLAELYSDIWMYWPLVCIQALIDSHAQSRERDRVTARLETQLTTARLAVLRAQIQPHFLFNTLHSIAALMRIDVRAAEDMVADLAEILRASFSEPITHESSLRRELELVRCYTRIQSCRFSERLKVNYQVAAETLDAAVPVLVLQSLVENAVIHGIAPADRPGTIEIAACRRGEQLILSVDDDGVGLRAAPRSGVGLSNARRRLRQLYGDQQSIELIEKADRGVTVTVSVPFRDLPKDSREWGRDEDTNSDRGR